MYCYLKHLVLYETLIFDKWAWIMNFVIIFIPWQIILVQMFMFSEYILIEANLIWLSSMCSYDGKKFTIFINV